MNWCFVPKQSTSLVVCVGSVLALVRTKLRLSAYDSHSAPLLEGGADDELSTTSTFFGGAIATIFLHRAAKSLSRSLWTRNGNRFAEGSRKNLATTRRIPALVDSFPAIPFFSPYSTIDWAQCVHRRENRAVFGARNLIFILPGSLEREQQRNGKERPRAKRRRSENEKTKHKSKQTKA